MDFQKKYPILQSPNEHVIVQWERGYKLVEIFYKDRSIARISGAGKLKNGVKLVDSELGQIELKLSVKPIALDVIIGGYHSPVNITYPTKELKSASTIFWVLAVLSVLGALFEGMSISMSYGISLGTIITFINILSISIYITTAILVKQGHAWAFFLGGGWYTLFTLYYASDLLLSGFYLGTFFIVSLRIVVTFMLAYYVKHAAASVKHKKYEHNSPIQNDILDDGVKY